MSKGLSLTPIAAENDPAVGTAPAAQEAWRERLRLERMWRLNEGTEDDPVSWRHGVIIGGAALALRLCGLRGRGQRNAHAPQLERHELPYPNLPQALQGFSILHLSDLHLSAADASLAEHIHAMLDGLAVDLCALSGDYRYGHFGGSDHVPERLKRALEGLRVRYGSYGILGNHDTSATPGYLREAGVTPLVNRGEALEIGGESIWIAGTDDPHKFATDRLDAALQDAPEGAFVLALIHSPELISEAADAGVDLYLCGHTHGGQIRLPYFGAIKTNARCDRQYIRGLWKCGKMLGHTSPGLGSTDLPLRFNCPPQATLLTLVRG